MNRRTLHHAAILLGSAALIHAAGCSKYGGKTYDQEDISFDPDRPEVGDDDNPIDPYTGDNEIVLEAQANFRTGLEFHDKVIWRTCTPNGGVCHNNK